MTDLEQLVNIINDFFGCDASYFEVNPFDLAVHLINSGVSLLTTPENLKISYWIYKPYEGDDSIWLYHCSNCSTPNARPRKYCNNCGAMMKEDINK
jgi:hypothetical protein